MHAVVLPPWSRARVYGVVLEKWARRSVSYACAPLQRFTLPSLAGKGTPCVACPLGGAKVH
ncbi:MAG: hypothetical protein V3S77_10465, partial [Acidiferrobacterales bacterium]